MRRLLLLPFLCFLVVGCSLSDNIDLTEDIDGSLFEEHNGTFNLTIDDETTTFDSDDFMTAGFNTGNPKGFLIHTNGPNVYPRPSFRIFIYDVDINDLVAGAAFSGEDELKMDYVLYNDENASSPSVYSAYTKDDVYLKITEVNMETSTISGTFNCTGLDTLDGWYAGGKTYAMEGDFKDVPFRK
ncbi:hypothetical protein H7U19_01090 [Hyunsoonleella sp. SJ7]|uniref:Lipoprotein n=1 Tax=Hyunsoonleella aquatilis TaxID=2762758 RepID=A0A923H852_9FLAO|nr:hypothetical protein [Hyunsoonleella aquatilis]MBC3756979.1 hypothetical protein [Hyunsoonleella aquatilis]